MDTDKAGGCKMH